MTTGETPDAGAEFAALMSGAAQAANPADEAPFGYTIDRATGEHRPKKSPGRPKAPPSLDELKEALAADPAAPGAEDRAPVAGRRKHRAKGQGGVTAAPKGDPESVPQHRPGVIAKGINRLYRRAGKIVKAMDRDIGVAIIESTKNTAEDGEPDDSVGAAWDEVARTNPQVRVFLLRVVAGGALGQLIMAHAPIAMAIVMKPAIAERIPFGRLLAAVADDDEPDGAGEGGAPSGLSGLLAGLSPEDMQAMAGVAQQAMGKAAAGVPPRTRRPGAASGKTAA